MGAPSTARRFPESNGPEGSADQQKAPPARAAADEANKRSPSKFLLRRRFIVRPRLQLPMLAASFSHVLAVAGVIAVSVFGPAFVRLLSSDPGSTDALDAANKILYLHVRFWPAVLLALVAVGLDSIRLSHRIAGPLVRINRALETLGRGSVPKRIRLRRRDALHEECARLNDVLDSLRGRVRDIDAARGALDQSIHRVRAGDPTSGVRDEKAWEALLVSSEQLAESTRAFTVEPSDTDKQ